MLMQLGVSERPYMVVEACSAPRPTQSLRGTLEQYQVQCARLRVSRDCNLLILMLPQIVQRDIVAAAAALLPRVHVVINKEPRKGAMEASITPASFGLAACDSSPPPHTPFQVNLFVPTPTGIKRFIIHSKIRSGQVIACPKPDNSNLKPQTPNLKLQTPNIKLQTPNRNTPTRNRCVQWPGDLDLMMRTGTCCASICVPQQYQLNVSLCQQQPKALT